MRAWRTKLHKALAGFWRWLRQVSEDDAYERYRATSCLHGHPVELARRDFYRHYWEHKYSRPSRCC